jgi:hypothetical protein
MTYPSSCSSRSSQSGSAHSDHKVTQLLDSQLPLNELVPLLGQQHLFPHALEAHGLVALAQLNRALLLEIGGIGAARQLGQSVAWSV